MTICEVAYLIITESAWDKIQPVKVVLIQPWGRVQVTKHYSQEKIQEMLQNIVNLDAQDEMSVIQRRLAIITWHIREGFGQPLYERALPSGNGSERTEICLPMPPQCNPGEDK